MWSTLSTLSQCLAGRRRYTAVENAQVRNAPLRLDEPTQSKTLDQRTQHLMTGCSHSRGSPRRSACIPAVGWPLSVLGHQMIAIWSPEKAQTAHHCAVVAPLVADDHTPTKLSGNEAIFLPRRDEGSRVLTSRFGSLRKACLMDNLDAAKPAFHPCAASHSDTVPVGDCADSAAIESPRRAGLARLSNTVLVVVPGTTHSRVTFV